MQLSRRVASTHRLSGCACQGLGTVKLQGRVGTLEGAVRKMVYCNVIFLRQSPNLRSTALASAQFAVPPG